MYRIGDVKRRQAVVVRRNETGESCLNVWLMNSNLKTFIDMVIKDNM